jgi:hypothetical protein
MSPDHDLGSPRDELLATLSTTPVVESELAQSAVRTFVAAMRADGATPEKTLVALKAILTASWPHDWNLPVRENDRAALISLCIDQYFRLGSHEPNAALEVVSHASGHVTE